MGTLILRADSGDPVAARFDGAFDPSSPVAGDPAGAPTPPPDVPDAALAEACRQLGAWFRGARTSFDLPLRAEGSEFELRVWAEVGGIPFEKTRSYAEVARALGTPSAAPAVGAANARHPVLLVVPCHRVVAADGGLTGYAGGLTRKRWLLDSEARQPPSGSNAPLQAAD